jgi:hypothetical protein
VFGFVFEEIVHLVGQEGHVFNFAVDHFFCFGNELVDIAGIEIFAGQGQANNLFNSPG